MIRSLMLSGLAVLVVLCTSRFSGADDSDSIRPLHRLKYNHPGLTVDTGVGLWAWPLPMDFDHDGDIDLIVSCTDVPFNGVYLFENPGVSGGAIATSRENAEAALPVFLPPVRLSDGIRNLSMSIVQGQPRVCVPGAELTGVSNGDFSQRRTLYPKTVLDSEGRIRANQWGIVDFDGDGNEDLFVGHGLWRDYGWDNAFDSQGRWTRGPLHGHVYVLRNQGTSDVPKYASPEPLAAGDKVLDVFGMPSPNFADFDHDGDLDLICGEFLDGFTYFENIGTRREPRYAEGRRLQRDDKPLTMPLCMIVVSSIDWDGDGDTDLVVGQEDGRVAMLEHTGRIENGVPIFADPKFFQQQADAVKFGALATPVSFDWDGDGDEDLVCGNTAGHIGWIENLDGGNPPRWAQPELLHAGGKPIRIMAGPNGSIQGPAEAKWGYTTIAVADWDHDGLADIVANSIWGKVIWFRNIGSSGAPRLADAADVRVRWPLTKSPEGGESQSPPKPSWNWWNPEPNQLVTQWRTTPLVVDWNQDGLNDLVMLDHEGYLALYPRFEESAKQRKATENGSNQRPSTGQADSTELWLGPGERIFYGGTYDNRHRRVEPSDPSANVETLAEFPLRLNNGTAGKSGRRKLALVDWNRDGRLDLLVNSVNVNVMIQRQVGERIVFEDIGPVSQRKLAGHTTSPTTIDWDHDGNRTVLIGAEDGHFYYSDR